MNFTRKFLGAALVALLFFCSACSLTPFRLRAHDASVAIFLSNSVARKQICSGTSIKSPSRDFGLVLTARHCVADLNTNEVYSDSAREEISFSDNEAGPYYSTEVYTISDNEDFAVLKVLNGGNLPYVELGDESKLQVGDRVFSWSFPLDTGKEYAIGRTQAGGRYNHLSSYFGNAPYWRNTYPVDILIGPGSSGSGIFDPVRNVQVGILVGTWNFGQKIVMPVSGVIQALKNPESLDAWKKGHPIQEEDEELF